MIMLGRLLLCSALVALSPQAAAPVSPLVSVWYPGPQAPATALANPDAVARDLGRIRRAGFNGITTWISWADAAPQPDTLRLAATERLIAAAAQHDLQVIVRIIASPPPAWAGKEAQAAVRFADAVRTGIGGTAGVRAIELAQGPGRDREPLRVGSQATDLTRARLAFWAAISERQFEVTVAASSGGLTDHVLALGETAGVVTRNAALFAPMQPRTAGVRGISGEGGAPIDVRILESPQALMIIALNRAASPRTATIQFAPDIPEAIWQNLETGAAVNFVMGTAGPYLEHSFAAYDALVLVIRKTLR